MKLISRNYRKKETGQALVEFVLMFPIFLGVLIGLVAFSMLFYSYITMQLAVREGTSAIVHDPKHQTVANIQTVVRSNSFALDPNQLSILVEPSNIAAWVTGAQVSVVAVYTVPMPAVNIPLIGGGAIRLGPIPITASSVMTIE